VPWLEDVPLLGALFRRDSDTQDRTTLYFFVTPHILQDHNFADLAEITYRKKLDAAEVIGADRLRVVDPTFQVSEDEIDWGQFDVPMYWSPERGEVDPDSVGIDPIRREELLRAEDMGPAEEPAPEPPAEEEPMVEGDAPVSDEEGD
jgi:hypothetical protein